ncbi:MAG: hypothetical protein ACE5OQ_12930, partial [Woeseia sp.]
PGRRWRPGLRPIAGGHAIEPAGAIPKMIQLSAGAESSRVGAHAGSVKVVAGARNHRESTFPSVEV